LNAGQPEADNSQFELASEIGSNRFNQALSNAVVDINDFAPPPAFTPGNAGRNIMTGPGALFDNLGEEELRLSW